jgi:hypothetical protein
MFLLNFFALIWGAIKPENKETQEFIDTYQKTIKKQRRRESNKTQTD